jgi:hypothetical protein
MTSQKNRWLGILCLRCLHRGRLRGRSWFEGRSLLETRIQRPDHSAGSAGRRLPTRRAHRLPSGGRSKPDGGCIRGFGSECAWLFGFGASSDLELEMTSKAGSDLSGGNVGEGVREIRSFL